MSPLKSYLQNIQFFSQCFFRSWFYFRAPQPCVWLRDFFNPQKKILHALISKISLGVWRFELKDIAHIFSFPRKFASNRNKNSLLKQKGSYLNKAWHWHLLFGWEYFPCFGRNFVPRDPVSNMNSNNYNIYHIRKNTTQPDFTFIHSWLSFISAFIHFCWNTWEK